MKQLLRLLILGAFVTASGLANDDDKNPHFERVRDLAKSTPAPTKLPPRPPAYEHFQIQTAVSPPVTAAEAAHEEVRAIREEVRDSEAGDSRIRLIERRLSELERRISALEADFERAQP